MVASTPTEDIVVQPSRRASRSPIGQVHGVGGSHLRWVVSGFLLAVWWVRVDGVAAQEAAKPVRSDAEALATLFGEDHLSDVLGLHRRVEGRSAAEAFAMYRDAVFPPNRQAIRIDIDFLPASEVARLTVDAADDAVEKMAVGEGPVPFMNGLISPAILLTRTAKTLDRLPELRRLLEERHPEGTEPTKEVLALRALLAIEEEDFERATDEIVNLTRLTAQTPVVRRERGPEAVVMWTATKHPELRLVANDLVYLVYEQTRHDESIRTERWQRHVFALKYLMEWMVNRDNRLRKTGEAHPPLRKVPLTRWHPVSRTDAEANAAGYPLASWHFDGKRIENLSGHVRDHLYYQVPLTGNFIVEADGSGFNYRDIRLGYGGIWAGPGYDHKSVLNERFGAERKTQPLAPPLDEIREPMRIRLIVRDGVQTTEVNGREVFRTAVSESDPWLSIVSLWYTHGWMENVRIMGDPVIPEQIDLITDPRLPGWNPYHGGTVEHGDTVGEEDSTWRMGRHFRTDGEQPTVTNLLVGHRDPESVGTYRESLLQYHRPLLEDGVIRYEYFHQADRSDVHPTLGRTTFLLRSDGVSLHRVTDNRSERTGADSRNAQVLSSDPLPLKPDAWNEVELRLEGSRCTIVLNGRAVASTTVEAENSRMFGLFHYRDRTEAKVRNIIYRGAWPKTLPEPHEQELADPTVENLLAKTDLPATFKHDFSQGLPFGRFLVQGEGWEEGFEQLPQGVKLKRLGLGWHVKYSIVPHLQVGGDFDIAAEFEQFGAETEAGGDGNIQLFVGFEEKLTEVRVYRKYSRFEKKDSGENIIQSADFYHRDGQRIYAFPQKTSEASTAGTLRMIRKGDQLYFLYAAEGSTNFRVIDQRTVPQGPTRMGDLRLVIENTKVGETRVVWKNIRVRAEQLSGLAMKPSLTVVDLDRKRLKLPATISFDLTKQATVDRIRLSGPGAESARVDEKGLRVVGPGFKGWRGTWLIFPVALGGDFDVIADLDVEKIEASAPGGESTAYLTINIADGRRTEIQSKFAISSRGRTTAELQLGRLKTPDEMAWDELGSIDAETASQLRIVRHDGVAYFLFKRPEAKTMELIGRVEVGNSPVMMNNLRLCVHTGGENRETIVRFRKLDIRATELTSPKPSLFQRFFGGSLGKDASREYEKD